MMRYTKAIYLIRILAFSLTAGNLLFWLGWYMGAENHKQKAIAFLKAGATHEASKILLQWSKSPEFKSDPAYFLSCALIHQKNGDHEAVVHNLERALELLGK